LGERLHHDGDIYLVKGRDEDAIALLFDDPETPDRGGVSVALNPQSLDKPQTDGAGADTYQLLGEVTHRLLHPELAVVHGDPDLWCFSIDRAHGSG
jgi:hypothetical protein